MTMSNTQQKQPNLPNPQAASQARKPNDAGTVVVQAHMKIFDPKTKQIYVEGRA
jgi:hypothetical protein